MRWPREWLVVVVVLLLAGGASTAWAAGLAVSSKQIAAGTRAAPSFYPNYVTVDNCSSGCVLPVAKAPGNGDKITLQFIGSIDQATMCAGAWSGTGNRSATVTVSINNNDGATGNDTLTITAVSLTTCTGGFKFGSIDLGSPGYVSGAITYPTTTFSLGNTSTAMVITLGGGSDGSAVASGSAAHYSCDAAMRSTGGADCLASSARSVATEQF